MASNFNRFTPPPLFTRVSRPGGSLPGYFKRPHDPATRRKRELEMLLFLLPIILASALADRFNPKRRPFAWSEPPTRASFARQDYPPAELNDLNADRLCSRITTTAGLIEWLLEAPEDAVGGLNRIHLLLVQLRRLRQLWQEVQRRAWPQGSLATFARALG